MYFSWRSKRCLAIVQSADGLRWSPPQIVLLPDENIEDEVNRPCVLIRAERWEMWFTSQCGPGMADGNSRIFYADSTDGIVWNRRPEPVLVPECTWEKNAVMCPHVLWDEERLLYRLWYSGGDQYEPDAIGYAESKDGRQWTKIPEPIFRAEPSIVSEGHKVTACQVIRHHNRYYMFYIGFEDEDTARIHLACSHDGISGWKRHPCNPILSPSQSFDKDACYKPFVLPGRDGFYLWYNGRNGAREQIGVAFHAGMDLGF